MRKLTFVVPLMLLMAAIVLLVVGPLYAAGLGTGDWPKPRRDAGNRGCSPTTAVAKPVIEWTSDTFGRGVNMSNGTILGPILDANNIYTVDEGNGPNGYTMAFKRDGSYLWTGKDSTGAAVQTAPIYYWNRSGLTLWNDGTDNYVLAGPGSAMPDYPNLYWLSAATGLQPSAGNMYGGFVGSQYYYVSYDAPAVGPDGTIYETISQMDPNWDSNGFSGGTIYAINSSTRALKWSWGADGTVPGGVSLGFHSGPLCVATVAGKTVLIFSGLVDSVDTTPNVYAIQDDGTSCSVLWAKRVPPAIWATPALSNDGQTVYVTTEQWQSTNNVTLFAFDVATGTEKWSINPHAELCSTPAVGADGTIYLTSTCLEGSERTDNSGKLIAVRDNGTSATIKWTMFLDYEQDSYFSSPVVNSGTPPTVYFGSTSGRTYAVQDLGSDYKMIWSRALPGVGVHNWPVPVIANDGHVYIHQGRYLYAFATGYTTPIGITGVVTDGGGNPISNAYVGASTGSFPLTDSGNKYYTKTDNQGRYVINVPAGTWNVAAWINGRVSSDPKSVTLATDSSTASADFTLRVAGVNLCLGKTASSSSAEGGNTASKVIDGDINSRWISSGAVTISDSAPEWLMVDLGADKSVGEAVMKWEAAYPTAYNIQYVKDGTDPLVEANWTTANTVFSTTTGAGGIAFNWITWEPKGATSTYASIAKFQSVSARYWRIKMTAASHGGYPGNQASMYEFELRSGMPPGPASGQCGDVRKMSNGEGVILESKRITALPGSGLPDDCAYIEDTDRSSAIRLSIPNLASKNFNIGDALNVTGEVATAGTGEKYVLCASVNRIAASRTPDALGMNNRDAASVLAQGLLAKAWGQVTDVQTGSFTITDGGTPVKVLCNPALSTPTLGQYIRIRGVLSTDGTGPVLYMRGQQVDWVDGNASYHPLPLSTKNNSSRDYKLLGVFGNTSMTRTEQLDFDFLNAADPSVTEATLDTVGKVGQSIGGKTWVRSDGGDEIVDLTKTFGPVEHCTVYAHVYIWSPTEVSPAVMVTGSDDAMKIWINGEEVLRVDGDRGAAYNQDLVLFTLKSGLNSVLFKVVNNTGGFRFVDQLGTWDIDNNVFIPYPTGLGYLLSR